MPRLPTSLTTRFFQLTKGSPLSRVRIRTVLALSIFCWWLFLLSYTWQKAAGGTPSTAMSNISIWSLGCGAGRQRHPWSFDSFNSAYITSSGHAGRPPHSYTEYQRPEAFHGCGYWQEEYMRLHREILSGERPPRYLVAVLPESGLADQVFGIISLFFWSFLTGRAFQITAGYQQISPLETAFDAPFINWTRPAGDPEVLTKHLYANFKGKREYPPTHSLLPNISDYGSLFLVNIWNGAYNFFSTADLNTIPEGGGNKSVLFVAANRGATYGIFDNPHHIQELSHVGLRPDTAFSCAFHFLFNLNNVTTQALETQLAKMHFNASHHTQHSLQSERRLLQAPRLLRIGLQIRVGDTVYNASAKQDDIRLQDYKSFFDCATQIQEHRRTPATTRVVWYLLSDSHRLKQLALEEFGRDVLVTDTTPNKHIVTSLNVGDSNLDDERADALTKAAADMLSFAEMDYFVLSQKSGFGKVGAMLSNRWHNVWWLNPQDHGNRTPSCGPKSYVKLSDLAGQWSGF